MPTALIVGATRGLGLALATRYSALGWTVLGTARSSPPDGGSSKDITWIRDIDISHPAAASKLAEAVKPHGPVGVTVITAGYFGLESFDQLDWEAELRMYTLSAVAPPFLVRALVEGGCLREGKGKGEEGGKVILVGSESGSVALRHEMEGGGNYGHHGSKAAVNMVGKLLSLDLKDKGVAVGVVHVSFLPFFLYCIGGLRWCMSALVDVC